MTLPPFVRRLAVPVLLLALAVALRLVWLTADPPTVHSVGVVWHDEGAWTHNARNLALWGVWRTDAWNPLFIAPVFTTLTAAVFEVAGVGLWQARLVPALSGVLAIGALVAGLWPVVGRRFALGAGLLLATNYTFVMWNRAALMESTMTAGMVVAWAAYAHAGRRPWLGALAGAAAVAAFFTKAAAAFFIAALAVETATSWWCARPRGAVTLRSVLTAPHVHVVTGLGIATALVVVGFVWPYWTEFQFYNWAMTVERKPSYGLADLAMRASWLPIVHDTFAWMWPVLGAACAAVLHTVARWREAHPAARLAVLWLGLGLLELVVHDSGNERRYVMFIPVLIALAAMAFRRDGDRPVRSSASAPGWTDRAIRGGVAAVLAYLLAGSLCRLFDPGGLADGDFRLAVRLSAGLAGLAGLAMVWRPPRLTTGAWPPAAAIIIFTVTLAADAVLLTSFARGATFLNVEASRRMGDLLPPGTLVHGKLANGLALENTIRPLFVGRGFGNYADRLERDDARYILSYTLPEPGYEGEVILDVLDHYPQRRIVAEFDVQETPGPDRAALIDKFPDGSEARARDQ